MRSGEDLRYLILAAQRERIPSAAGRAAGPHTCVGRGDDGAEREPFTIGELACCSSATATNPAGSSTVWFAPVSSATAP
jgi:hypothetical protein